MRAEIERLFKQAERDLYTTARYPDAANGIPYEIYDRATAEAKVEAAEALFGWLRRLMRE
ncbi:MAG: hypothetical protein AMS25_08810 [Gemmatimonas sp. SM23_52]|nr:MAG: hypothetical protein AMS25_08810 [Gemmatimonas sp. SM23_52]